MRLFIGRLSATLFLDGSHPLLHINLMPLDDNIQNWRRQCSFKILVDGIGPLKTMDQFTNSLPAHTPACFLKKTAIRIAMRTETLRECYRNREGSLGGRQFQTLDWSRSLLLSWWHRLIQHMGKQAYTGRRLFLEMDVRRRTGVSPNQIWMPCCPIDKNMRRSSAHTSRKIPNVLYDSDCLQAWITSLLAVLWSRTKF